MPRTTLALSSFVSGEFSAKLDGRTDFEKYSSGCKTMENMLVHPQGASTRRVGTQFISEIKDTESSISKNAYVEEPENEKPTALITIIINSGNINNGILLNAEVGDIAEFSGSTSFDSDGIITTYLWIIENENGINIFFGDVDGYDDMVIQKNISVQSH